MAEGLHLPTAAATLVGLAAAMHLAIGVDALTATTRLLPMLLVLWGTVVMLGIAATAAGTLPRRPAYAGGVALLVVALVGYVDVYALGVSETALGVDWHPPSSAHHGGSPDGDGAVHHGAAHHHGTATDGSFFARLAAGHYALPSKLIELVSVGLLLLLLARDRTASTR